MLKVSYSRVSCYQDCPQKHHFRYVRNLRAKKTAKPLVFGKDFHSLLQVRTSSKKSRKQLALLKDQYYDLGPKAQADLGDNYLDNLELIFNDYQEVWKDSKLKPTETEHEFMILVGKLRKEPVYFHGFVDEVYDDELFGEHKTYDKMPNMSVLAMNPQTCLYAKARYLETGKKFRRVLWDYTRSSPSQQPVFLEKSQRFSEAANSNITPMSWLRACAERDITDSKTLAIAEKYAPNISNFFWRCQTEIVPEMVDTVWDSFKETTRRIAVSGPTDETKHISRNCSWCEYFPICFAQFTGADVKHVLKTDFVVKEREE